MSLPVDLEKIARERDIVLIPYDFPENISGMAYIGRRKFVLYNINHPLPRRRFTIAHEIYHIEKHLGKERNLLYGNTLEKEADAGAAKILLPCEVLKTYLEEPRWFYDLTSLARKAIVSPITLVKRLNEARLLNVSLFKLSFNGRTLSIIKLAGKKAPLPGYSALAEGARRREFFLERNHHLYRFSNYGKTALLYVYRL